MSEKTPPQSLGEQELELLRYVSDHAPISVRDVAEQYGEPRKLARTTILTVMERLRKKGFLTRRKEGSVFEYSPAVAKTQLLQRLVGDFVHKTLEGSLTPFVAYLSDSGDFQDHEIAELRQLLDRIEDKKKAS